MSSSHPTVAASGGDVNGPKDLAVLRLGKGAHRDGPHGAGCAQRERQGGHGLIVRQRLERADYHREVWQGADALHLLGEDLWRRAQRRGCPPDKPHALIPPAIDVTRFDPQDKSHQDVAGTPGRPLRSLSVARLEWTKGYEFALEAVRLLKEQGVNCLYQIVGTGAHLESVAFARHQLGLAPQVELLGALTPEQIRPHLRAADVFLHAAVSEGFCNAVLEAQAMRLPVVCSDAGGLAENVVDGRTGFVVPRRKPAAIAEKLARLARDPDLRERMGQAGRARVIESFDLERQAQRFLDLYEQVQEKRTAQADAAPHGRPDGFSSAVIRAMTTTGSAAPRNAVPSGAAVAVSPTAAAVPTTTNASQ